MYMTSEIKTFLKSFVSNARKLFTAKWQPLKLPLKVKIYIYGVIALAAAVVITLLYMHDIRDIDINALLFWAAMGIITESMVVRLPSGMGLSVGLAISLASLLASGPLVATIVTGSSFLFRITSPSKGVFSHLFNTSPFKTLFNTAQGMVSIGIAGIVFSLWWSDAKDFNIMQAVQVVAFYTTFNSFIMSAFFSLLSGEKLFRTWMSNMRGIFINLFFVGLMGVLLYFAANIKGQIAVILFYGPLLLSRYSFKQYIELRETYLETLKLVNKLLEARDQYTGEHSSRVEKYAVELAKYLGLSEKRVEKVRMAATLHDLGKLKIDDSILRKPDKLTDEEFELIKQHPAIGADMLNTTHFLKEISPIIRQHHEKYDGSGYPSHLSGEQICDEADILSLADVYDAITSTRSYRHPFTYDQAQKEIERCAGTQFDPKMAKAFIELVKSKPEVFNRDVD